jgi:hypothetical protein
MHLSCDRNIINNILYIIYSYDDLPWRDTIINGTNLKKGQIILYKMFFATRRKGP